jgi:hypothetical protein
MTNRERLTKVNEAVAILRDSVKGLKLSRETEDDARQLIIAACTVLGQATTLIEQAAIAETKGAE